MVVNSLSFLFAFITILLQSVFTIILTLIILFFYISCFIKHFENHSNNSNPPLNNNQNNEQQQQQAQSNNIMNRLPLRNIDEYSARKEIECEICLDNLVLNEQAITAPCFHQFHHLCMRDWLNELQNSKQKQVCPSCRHPIDEYD